VPVQQADAWASSLPNAQISTVANAGHLVLEESPEGMRIVKEILVS
jgi:pimeloyl-ACP methyl ester carboxylesterase